MGRGRKIGIFRFGTDWPYATVRDWALGTGQAIGAHTGAGGQCTDAIKAGVGADGLALIHMGIGNGSIRRAKGGGRGNPRSA